MCKQSLQKKQNEVKLTTSHLEPEAELAILAQRDNISPVSKHTMHRDARLAISVSTECHASDSLLLLLDEGGETTSIASHNDRVTLLGILTHTQGSYLLIVRFDCLLNLALDNHWHVLIDFEYFY